MTTQLQNPVADNKYAITAGLFLAGAAVTAVFSGSLAKLAPNADLAEVLTVGMIVPSFTWVVQLTISGLLLPAGPRWRYWVDLGWACLIGSVALLPAAFVNLAAPAAPLWLSAVNVLTSVGLMAAVLYWRTARYSLSPVWPVSWCLTISVNMALFLWASRGWWATA